MRNLAPTLMVAVLVMSGLTACQRCKRITLVGPTNTLDSTVVARLPHCAIEFKLKAGMTQSEANGAIDDAWDGWESCMKAAQLPDK
jgi:hypothetical protein